MQNRCSPGIANRKPECVAVRGTPSFGLLQTGRVRVGIGRRFWKVPRPGIQVWNPLPKTRLSTPGNMNFHWVAANSNRNGNVSTFGALRTPATKSFQLLIPPRSSVLAPMATTLLPSASHFRLAFSIDLSYRALASAPLPGNK